jgi:hypothetical protein
MSWKPIESAPTGETILVWAPHMNRPQFAVVWHDGAITDDEDDREPNITGATHWTPSLPPPTS